MASGDLSFWDYLKAAFNWKTPVPLLGRMPLNKLALAGFAILGFGNPGFWLLGVGLEAAYLLMLAGNPRFQNVVSGMRMLEMKDAWAERQQDILARLDRKDRERYQRLVEQCRAIVRTDEGSSVGEKLADLKSDGLNQLLGISLKLLTLRSRIQETLSRTRSEDLQADIDQINAKIAAEKEDSPVRRALQGTLEIQQTRLANLNKSLENLKFTDTELDRIEKQVSLIAEEIAVSRDPEQWSVTLDGVVKSIQGTSRWVADNSALFDTMESSSSSVDIFQPPPRTGIRQ